MHFLSSQQAQILHIVIAKEMQGKGIGTLMINWLCTTFTLQQVIAQTDQEAVNFYIKCGFICTVDTEQTKEIKRFLCIKELKLLQ